MTTLMQELKTRPVQVSDGAWGTALQNRGLEMGACPEMWNIDHPGEIRAIAEAYRDAGAQLLTTNTFGGTRFKLGMRGLEDRVAEINRAAAAIAREVMGPDAHILGSIGPSGHMLLTGDITEEELYEGFAEQAKALEEGGADVAVVETMSAIDEASIAVRAARENTRMEIICSFTYNLLPDGQYRTMMGVSPTEMAAALLDAGADIIGTNCTLGPKEMVGVVQELRAAAPDTPVLASPNAGSPTRTEEGEDVFPETPESMAEAAPALLDAGVNILGGCCGTTDAHIRAIAKAVAEYRGASA